MRRTGASIRSGVMGTAIRCVNIMTRRAEIVTITIMTAVIEIIMAMGLVTISTVRTVTIVGRMGRMVTTARGANLT